MQYKALKLYRPAPHIVVPPNGVDKKNVCFGFLGENVTFSEAYRFLKLKPQYMKYVFVPRVTKPARSWLTSKYKKTLMGFKLKPFNGFFGDYSRYGGHNFFIDYSGQTEALVARFKIKRYISPKAIKYMLPLITTLGGVPEEDFERTILYVVSIDNPISPKIFNKRIYMLYAMLLKWKKSPDSVKLPFDKILMFVYGATAGGKYILLFDKNKSNNLSRLKSIIKGIRMGDMKDEMDEEVKETSEEIVITSELTKELPEKEQEKTQSIVSTYIKDNPELTGFEDGTSTGKVKINQVITAAILSNTVGDSYKADRYAKKLATHPKDVQKRLVEKHKAMVLPKQKVSCVSRDPIIKAYDPETLTNGSNPKHILEKRKSDFKETLVNDIIGSFKTLNTKELPLKVHSINIKTLESPASELYPTVKDRYTVKLLDKDRKVHTVQVELPHLNEDGMFITNGQKKVIVNQIITYPIFFFKAYFGMFMSSYAAVKIHSKILRKASYFIVHMAGYKMPLFLLMAYKLGFDETCKMFGLTYTLGDKKGDNTIYLPTGKYLTIKSTDDVGEQMASSLEYAVTSFPKEKFNLQEHNTWKRMLENFTGNRNCTYLIDQVWANVVTPIEIKLLESRGDPTTIDKIIRYICSEVVTGRVDDRNGLGRQRIRTSELFVSLLQKQILAAYNEFEMKKQSGDPDARLKINATKVFSQVVNSQNVQSLENINPAEELAMMTRVTPVGIGGIPDKEALPGQALMVHDSYYGNIDPLETPNGPGVGVQQQLTLGASITNIRGTFAEKDRSKINSTDILSTGPALIPFVESNDGCRVTMASGQLKQAIPLDVPEKPMIQSGFEGIFTPLLSDSFIKKAPVDGIVEQVTDQLIIIRDKTTSKKHTIDVTPTILRSGQGKNGLGRFNPIIKVGDAVSKGAIIAEGANIKEGLISNGINLLSCFMPWKGFNFEDGMVISESVAKRFVSLHVEEQNVYITEDEDVEFISTMGSELKKGDILLTYSEALHDVESHKHLRSDGGKIVNIEIFSNVEEKDLPPELMSTYRDFKERYKLLRGDYPVGKFKEKGELFEGILIKFTLQQALTLEKGDKINNRHFNKGITALIEKNENMPVTPWGERIDIVYNPLSIINRMNTGQLCELHTGLISWKLGQLVQEMKRSEFEKMYAKVLDLLDGTDNKKSSNNVIKTIKSLSSNGYKNFVARAKRDNFIPMVFVPFKSPPRNNIVLALKVVGMDTTYPLYLPEYGKKTDPVSVGYMYVMKLEHISEKKIHGRSVGSYVGKTLAPTAGKKRGGAGAIGEYDMYSLLSWDCPILIDEFFGPSSSDHGTKNEMISDIIQSGKTEFKATRSNPVKDLYGNMMLAIHLTAE